MLNSSNRMNFIIEYMSSYKEKIKLANSKGLFDFAKMFELFAIEVCNLLYGKKFENLNDEKANFPYFDLISEDKQFLVQVSTVKYVPSKIKRTLEKIRDSKEEKYSRICKVIFFVLHNDSIDKIKEYSGKEQIGNIPFTKKENLITTDDIINKAQSNLDFQEKLYSILKQEFENFNGNSKKLYDVLEFSKKVGIKNIDTLINNEYEIKRENLIQEIKKENHNFISIQGSEGCGKSALCKKIVEKEKIVLYARAEKFIEERHLEDIWKINVREILEYLNGRKIVFFIDALEFIADSPKTKFDLLENLYSLANEYKNVYIITSCRTSDKNSFIQLESKFNIKTYEIDDISEEELSLLKQKYPAIDKISNNKEYAPLLKTPFYVNMIVSKTINIDNIDDTNSFRGYIWENIICLREKAKLYGITYDKIKESINQIVFERARKFLLGIHKDGIDSKIVQALISEGIIVEQGKYIRLKYDIFEDICFEHYFDKIFDECKGEFETFYNEIEKLGRCVYRRYQIWISNKLFIQLNRNKFLYNLIFSNKIPQEWRKQTEIGIVKSRFCNDFFKEQTENIVECNLLSEFIKIVNIFAFDAKILDLGNGILDIQLIPIGNGRTCIIRILKDKGIYKNDVINHNDIIKLCFDYVKQNKKEKEIMEDLCSIIEYYVEYMLDESKEQYGIINKIGLCLETLYMLADISKNWLKKFFETQINNYISGQEDNISEDIMEWTLKNAYPLLIKELSNELCLIANTLWLRRNKQENSRYIIDDYSTEAKYGLSELAAHYHYSYRTVNENVFLNNLFCFNFKCGLEWAIQFINKTIKEYASDSQEYVTEVEIKFNDNSNVKKYWGNCNMWLAGIKDYNVPTLIGDIVFCLKNVILNTLERIKNNKKVMIEFADYIKDSIYSKSNNIVLLTIIEAIGMRFQNELPGFAIELATSIEIINWDFNRYMLYIDDPLKKMLEKQIMMTVGIPKLNERYDLDLKCKIHMQEYILNAQIYFDSAVRNKCYSILDYLYTIIKNDTENARDYLQIQKMDMRGAKVTNIDNMIILNPKITGEAQKVVEKHEESNILNKKLKEKIEKFILDKNVDVQEIIDTIKMILSLIESESLKAQYESILIPLISIAMKRKELEIKEREEFCVIWLNGVEKLFCDESFVFNIELIPVLLKQMEEKISIDIKNKIKKMILKCLMYRGHNGVINQITKYIKEYLISNNVLAKAVFNTIIKLAEDEMKHQEYNVNYYKMNLKEGKNFEFVPNMQPKLSWMDGYIRDNNEELYISEKDEIISKYLLQEKSTKIDNFNINNYDISTMCYVANCGLTFNDSFFYNIIKSIIICMIDIWNYNKKSIDTNRILDTYAESEIIEIFQREMIQTKENAKKVIDILFDNIDFKKFTTETIEFYQNIFSGFACEFFDSYNDLQRRNTCKNKILYIEKKLNEINEENVKIHLYKSLMFSVRRDFRRLERM